MRGLQCEANAKKIRYKCQKNDLKYNTYMSRIQNGFSESEAVNGITTVCKCCGKEYQTFSKHKKYCSEECRHKMSLEQKRNYRLRKKSQKIRDIENGEGDLSAIYNRPLTPDTKYLVNLWHNQGDSIEDIAYILRRPVSVINSLICKAQ